MFPTKTKDSSTIGLEGLRKVCAAVNIPVVAIGGITTKTAAEAMAAGAAGMAVVSAIFGQEDVAMATMDLAREVGINSAPVT